MKKLYIVTLLLLASFGAKAQQLATYVPADAQAVATIKGGNIIDLISVSEFSQSMAGKALLQQISQKIGDNFTKLSDFGVQLDANAYYFYKRTDSVNYQCVLLPLADASKFGLLFKKDADNIEKKGDYAILHNSENNAIIWDNQKALIVFGDVNSYFFSDNAISKRYGIPDVYGYYDYDNVKDVEVTGLADSAYSPGLAVESMPIDTTSNAYSEAEEVSEAVESAYSAADADRVAGIPVEPASDNDDYYTKQQIKDYKLDSLASLWTVGQAEEIFGSPLKNSILKNPDYIKSLDPKAEASIWISNPFLLYGSSETLNELMLGSKLFSGIGAMKAHLYVEDDYIKVKTTIDLSDELAESAKRIYNRKINRKFLKYINSEKALGFMGYAINTEAYLQELPKIIANAYPTALMGLYSEKETVNFVINLVSIVLDEEAIAEVIKGDALIVLNGVSEKDVTYTDYEYDDNFNSIPVQKTKTETIPDFLFMLSSDNTEIIDKLLALAIKEEKAIEKNGIYYLDVESDFTFHILLKDGIVFIGTSIDEINRIKKGTFIGKVSQKHRKLIRKNTFMACFSSGNVYKAIPKNELLLFTNKAPFIGEMKNMGDWYLKSNGIKGKLASAEFVVETPDNHDNALKYLLSLFDALGK